MWLWHTILGPLKVWGVTPLTIGHLCAEFKSFKDGVRLYCMLGARWFVLHTVQRQSPATTQLSNVLTVDKAGDDSFEGVLFLSLVLWLISSTDCTGLGDWGLSTPRFLNRENKPLIFASFLSMVKVAKAACTPYNNRKFTLCLMRMLIRYRVRFPRYIAVRAQEMCWLVLRRGERKRNFIRADRDVTATVCLST